MRTFIIMTSRKYLCCSYGVNIFIQNMNFLLFMFYQNIRNCYEFHMRKQ